MKKLFLFFLIQFFFIGCSENKGLGIKLEPKTPTYKVAMQLSKIYPFLDPGKNSVLIKSKSFTVTTGDVIEELNVFFPTILKKIMEEKNSNEVKKLIYSIAEKIAKSKIYLKAAESKKITVTAKVIDSLLLKFRLANVKPENLKAYLKSKGKTIEFIKRKITNNEIIKTFINKELKGEFTATPEEVKSAYNNSEYLNLQHIFIYTNYSNKENRNAKINLMNRIKNMLKEKFSFTELAKKYSDDVATAKYGGIIKGVRKGKFSKKIDDIIFKLQDNDESEIIESGSGLHLFRIIKHVKETRSLNSVYKVYKSQVEMKKRIIEEKKLFGKLKEKEKPIVEQLK